MGVVVNEEKKHAPIPVAEQTKLINYVISLVKKSSIFAGVPVSLNFIDSSRDCICVRLQDDTYKTAEYVDGSYEAQVVFMLVYRRLHVTNVEERLNVIDLVNQFGEEVEAIEEFDTGIEGVDINSVTQKSPAGLIYRDNSGIEDNGAVFILRYDKN